MGIYELSGGPSQMLRGGGELPFSSHADNSYAIPAIHSYYQLGRSFVNVWCISKEHNPTIQSPLKSTLLKAMSRVLNIRPWHLTLLLHTVPVKQSEEVMIRSLPVAQCRNILSLESEKKNVTFLLTPMNQQHLNSPYNITPESNTKVRRTKEMITNSKHY